MTADYPGDDPFGDVTCVECGTRQPRTRMTTAADGPMCLDCSADHGAARKILSPVVLVPALLLGLAGAALGAGVWAAISIVTTMEIGYVAILVGFLSGAGVALGARGMRGMPLPPIAALCAVLGLVGAKYAIVAHVVVEQAAAQGEIISHLDPRILSIFAEFAGDLVSPFDLLWVALAVGAAWRIPADG
jgi:hypothetical protein